MSCISEIALCHGSLVLQESKTLCLAKRPDAVVMLRIESASAFSTTKEQRNSLPKESVTR